MCLPNDPDSYTKTHYTPFVIWNNFVPADQEKLHLTSSPSFLGPMLLHVAGVEGSYYTDYLYELSKKIPVIPPQDMWSAYNIQESDLAGYEKLQYDNLFGGDMATKQRDSKIRSCNLPTYSATVIP